MFNDTPARKTDRVLGVRKNRKKQQDKTDLLNSISGYSVMCIHILVQVPILKIIAVVLLVNVAGFVKSGR